MVRFQRMCTKPGQRESARENRKNHIPTLVFQPKGWESTVPLHPLFFFAYILNMAIRSISAHTTLSVCVCAPRWYVWPHTETESTPAPSQTPHPLFREHRSYTSNCFIQIICKLNFCSDSIHLPSPPTLIFWKCPPGVVPTLGSAFDRFIKLLNVMTAWCAFRFSGLD